jgi:hypothetical protein
MAKVLNRPGSISEPSQLHLLARSAFRTLGLPASASQKEIYEKASALRLAHKLGVEKTFDEDLPWLGRLSRTEADVRDALGRLADPPQRILERLFWFHERLRVERPSNLAALRSASDRLLEGESAASLHDAALLLLASLHRLDPDFKHAPEWSSAFALWREVAEREEFWSLLVAADLKGDFEQLVTFGEVKALRERTTRLLTAYVAERAMDAVARDDFNICERALGLLRGAQLPAALLDEYLDATLGPLEDRVEQLCDSAFYWLGLYTGGEESNGGRRHFLDQAWKDFHWKVKPPLRRFFHLAGVESHRVRRTCEHAAEKLCELAAAYNRQGLPKHALFVYRQALTFAPPGSAPVPSILEGLRALDASIDIRPRSDAEYANALAAELSETRPPPKLFDDAEFVVQTATVDRGETLKGCLGQMALYALMIAGCFMLNECGIINTRRSRSNFPPGTMNFNYTAPRIVIPPMPKLGPLNISPLPTPPKRTRRRQRPTQPKGNGADLINRPEQPPASLTTPRRSDPGATGGPPKN